MGYADYKKSRQQILENTKAQAAKNSQSENVFEKDLDDWYPKIGKDGNGTVVIRLLPPLENEGLPIVKWFSHAFNHKPTGRWYIENSLKTQGKDVPDPVANFNKKLWDSTSDPEAPARKQASNQKRKLNYRCNVYIVEDPNYPENNGKIKKWKFSKTFHDMIEQALNPPAVFGEKPIDPFDLIDGANLRINIFTETKGDDSFPNYSRSKWLDCGPLADEKKIEAIYNALNSDSKWSLKQYIADDKFKTFDQLKERLDFVLGFDTVTGKPLENSGASAPATEQKAQATATVVEKTPVQSKNSSLFQSMVDDDDIPF